MRLTEKIVLAFTSLCFLGSLTFFLLNQYQIIFFPFQHELREAAIVPVVRLLAAGDNPFDSPYQPYSFYAYGIGFPTIVSKLLFLQLPPLQTARLATTIAILVSSFLIFLTLKKMKVPTQVILPVIGIFLFDQAQYANLGFPNASAVFMLLLGYYAATRFNYNLTGCIIACLIFILGFAVKQYILIGLPVVILYCFIRNGFKKGLILTAVSISLFICFVYWLNLRYETYFIVTYDAFKGATISSFYHMKDQLLTYLTANMYLVFGLVCAGSLWFATVKNKWSVSGMFDEIKNADFYFVAFAAGFGAFIVKLGWHEGACCGLYLYHIASPFLLIFLAGYLSKNMHADFFMLCISLLALVFSYRMYHNFSSNKIILKGIASQLSGMPSKLSAYPSILNSPEFTSLVQGPIYNNGSTEFFVDALNVPVYEKYKLTLDAHHKYKDQVNQGIAHQKFDLIQQTRNYTDYNYVDKQILEKYYRLKEIVKYPMLFGGWEVEFWVKK